MHEEVITTTSKFNNSVCTIVNSNPANLHQSNLNDGGGTITVSIVHHPLHHSDEIGDFISSDLNDPCSTLTTNQIVPSQSSNELPTLNKEDVSSIIINGSLANPNDPNVLILPETETCDSEKNSMSLSHLQADQIEQELNDVNSANDETSNEDGEFFQHTSMFFFLPETAHYYLCC